MQTPQMHHVSFVCPPCGMICTSQSAPNLYKRRCLRRKITQTERARDVGISLSLDIAPMLSEEVEMLDEAELHVHYDTVDEDLTYFEFARSLEQFEIEPGGELVACGSYARRKQK